MPALAPPADRRRTVRLLVVGGLASTLPPVVALAASETTAQMSRPDDDLRKLGIGDNPFLHGGTVAAVLAMAFAALVWSLWSSVQRVRHADQIHAKQQQSWERMLAASEARVAKLESTVDELISDIRKESDKSRDLSQSRDRLASMGRELDQTKDLLRKAQTRLDEHMALLRLSTGGVGGNFTAPEASHA